MLRFGCLPTYLNLVLFSNSKRQKDAAQLINFLSRLAPDQITRPSDNFQWSPTRNSINERLGLLCPPANAIRPSLQTQQLAQSIAQELQGNLRSALQNQNLNVNLATIYDPSDKEPSRDSQTFVVAVPVDSVLTESDLKAQQEKSLILGALRVGANSTLGTQRSASGDYVLQCSGNFDESVSCQLISPNGKPIELNPDKPILLKASAGQTAIYFEQGSTELCIYIDSRKICIKIG